MLNRQKGLLVTKLFSFLVNLGKLQRISLESSDGEANHVNNVIVSSPPGRLVSLLGKEFCRPVIGEMSGDDAQCYVET